MKTFVLGTALLVGSAGYVGITAGAEAATAPATAPSAAVDVKNTKCVVARDDVGDSKITAEYKGKLYHFCCADCLKEFKADPDKYAKAVEKDPGAFGAGK